MNILVITPFYYIEGRPELFHDTSVIHYFTKYWAQENNVCVLNIYPHSYKQVAKYAKSQTQNDYKNGYDFIKDNVKVRLIEVQKLPGQNGHYNKLQVKRIIRQSVQFIKNLSFTPDVIVAHVPSYAESFVDILKEKINSTAPVIGVLHYTDIEELRNRSHLCNVLQNSFDYLYPRSHGILKMAQQYSLKNLHKDIVQSGIPLEVSRGLQAPTEINDHLNLIYVGKLIPRKNTDKIIEAINSLKDLPITLDIVGAGSEEQKLKALVGSYNLKDKVKFCGTLTRDEVIKKMACAHMFCMPSINETLGLTYIEAMSVGCVPIGTTGEGIDGVIQNGKNGYLAEKSNITDSLKSILKAYYNLSNSERATLSKNACETAQGLDEKDCSENYLKLIKRSIGYEGM